MSYQRWTTGDAYVIGVEGHGFAGFECVGCQAPGARVKSYGEINAHLETHHRDSGVALARLREEAAAVGLDANFEAYWAATEA